MFTKSQLVLAWGLVAFLAVVDAVFLALTDFSFTPNGLWHTFVIGLSVYGIALFLHIPTSIEPLHNVSLKFRPIILCLVYIFTLSFFFSPFSYISVALNRPLIDGELAAIDAMMGLDWKAWIAYVNETPALVWIMAGAYHSAGPMFILLLLVMGLRGRRDRLGEMSLLFGITLIIVLFASAFFPAVGAYNFHAPAPETYSNYSNLAAVYHTDVYQGLRDGSLRVIDLADIKGFVTFPSFHTCLALIVAWCFRGFPWLFRFSSVLAALILVSTLNVGGHYLTDVLGGIAVTVFAVWITKLIEKPAVTRRSGQLIGAVQRLGARAIPALETLVAAIGVKSARTG